MTQATGNPRTVHRLLGVLLLASALSVRADSVTLTLGAAPASAVTNGTLVPITVTATLSGSPSLVATSLNFRTLAPLCTNTWNTLPLSPDVTPNTFLATLPCLPTGKVEFAASCTYVDSSTSATATVASVTNSYTVGAIMATVRQQTFESGWTNNSGSLGAADGAGWWGTNIYIGWLSTGAKPNSSTKFAYLMNYDGNRSLYSTNTHIVSPILNEGVATISFAAILRSSGYPASFAVEVWTNDVTAWEAITNYNLSSSLSSVTQALARTIYAPARVRFMRTSFNGSDSVNNSAIVLDNIRISPAAANVQLAEPADAITPKDPLTNDTVTIACNVQDLSTNAPSINRRMKLFYAWTATNGAAASTNSLIMTNSLALPDQYSAVIPALGAGTNRYYFRCDFDGYYYTNSERRGPYYLSASGQTSTNVIPPTTNQFSYTINASNVRAMRLLPAGGLGFGLVVTNATTTNTLLVCNDGNASLNITNILSDSPCFAALPTSFAVAAQRTQSVSVVFQPLTKGPYVATLTVLSDKTTGTNTCVISGTGADPEAVTPPTLSGPAAGTLAQSLAFSASAATNNWGYGLQYQFSSSDGWTSSWSSATSASYAWNSLGTRLVYAQARSTTNPAVVSALSSPLSVLITNTARITLGGVTNFGIVAVNQSSNLVLQITNAGPGSLTISNITITNTCFTSLTTSLVVRPNTASNVLLRFAPLTPGTFTDLVVVASDATSGTNTWRVTGVGEQITLPLLQPANTTNTLYTNNTFTACATNSTGEALNYQFDWGDGTAPTWGPNVASGVTYTNTHAWNVITTNSTIQVKARCATHTNNITSWSTALVTITNAYIMGLSPTLLDFGSQVTNQTTTRTLTINNVGNGLFNVESLTCPSGFAVVTNFPFALAPGASTSVTLTFTPAALAAYGGMVTVNTVQSMGGVRTLMVTGYSEVVSTPVCTNAFLASHVNDPQLFGFAATSTLGHAVEYYYTWGDGATTNWTNSATMAHAWGATNDYPLLVRARCLEHTNIVSSWSVTNLVRVYDPPLFTFSMITNGQSFQVTMTATGAAPGWVTNCVFYYLPPLSATAQTASMTNTPLASVYWKATLPPLNPGDMRYGIQYTRGGITMQYPALGFLTTNLTNSLGVRQDNFQSGWTGSTGYYTVNGASGWWGTNATVIRLAASEMDPNYPPSYPTPTASKYLYLWNKVSTTFVTNSFLRTATLPEGIGTIYFEAVVNKTDYSASLKVQISTNYGAAWVDVSTDYTLAGSLVWRACIPLNVRRPALVQIVRTSFDPTDSANNTAILLDNIRISPPPTDVQITEVFKNPGYPNCKDPVRVRCQTADYTNLVTGAVDAPSVNRRLSVYYKHDSMSSFVATNMTATGANSYEGEIPTSAVGAMQYFFRCDFDGYYYSNNIYAGTALANLYPSEMISPAYLPDPRADSVLATYPVPTTANALNYTIRPFRSEQERVWIQCTPTNAAREMDLVDDYTWQGTTLISGITNLTWYYQGYAPYSNNATALGTVATWGDTNQYYLHYPPMGGNAELGASQPMRAELTYDGLLLHRFVTTAASYLVRKGVYQTFDDWQARQDYFEDSLGLYAANFYTNYFSGWSVDLYASDVGARTANFTGLAPGWNSVPKYFGGLNWATVNSMAVAERNANTAMLLNNGTVSSGAVWNVEDAGLTEGAASFACRARLSQNDGRYAVGGLHYSWTNAYRLTNTIYVASMTPGSASISTLFCYRPEPSDLRHAYTGFTFYELRLTQENDSNMKVALFRWNNDTTSTLIKNIADWGGTLTGGAPFQVDIAWTNIGGTNVWFAGKIYRDNPASGKSWTTNDCKDTDTSRCIKNGGGVGFLCSDATMEVRALSVFGGTNLTDSARISATPVFDTSSWYLGDTWAGKANCWAINNGLLQRLVPTSRLNIYTYRNGSERSYNQDLAAWTLAAQYPVSSFNYSNFVCQLSYWDKAYVMARFGDGELPIVVDDLALEPWRAYTRGVVRTDEATVDGVKFWDWTDVSQQYAWSQSDTGWLLFEGMVTNTGANTHITLDASRGNPNLSQGIWSLVLGNGLGSIAFRAWVTNGITSRYRVEVTDPDFPEYWLPVESFSNCVADGVQEHFVPIRIPNVTGRIRIVQLPTETLNGVWTGGGSAPGAVLNLDNLTVRDYPAVDSGTWRVYNCLVAPPRTNNQTSSRAYETNALDHRTCYLNNSPTNGVLAPGSYTDANPYLQTPTVDSGIGQVAFYYRAWDSNAVQVSIQAAASEAGPWTMLTNFTVTSTNYAYFDTGTTLYDPNDTILRIYVTNALATPATTGRLCIDNVLVAESVRPSYTITDVQLLPAQPLATNQVGVRVTIDRMLMSPQGNRLFLSYVTGTSNWGYRNWWGTGSAPTAGVVTVELTNTSDTNSSPQVFVSAGNAYIPPTNIDEVVQYLVWGTVASWTNYPILQGTNTFTNPSWYYPVDLNRDFAAQGWSPYYYVYSCPPGSVWVNEINYYKELDSENEFVELVGPYNANLGNWQFQLFDYRTMSEVNCSISNGVVLTNVSMGWGFFVYGVQGVENNNHVFDPVVDGHISSKGGLRLIRSMGAWEDQVSWGDNTWKDPTQAPEGFRYAGKKETDYPTEPLALMGTAYTKYEFTWLWDWIESGSGSRQIIGETAIPFSCTPGRPNEGQGFPNVWNYQAGYFLISVLGLHGSHSLLASTIQLSAGATTSVTYTADEWYRIQSFATDGTTNGAAVNRKQFVWAVTNMQQNYSNSVSFYPLPEVLNTNGVPAWWLAGFGRTESAPFFGPSDRYSLSQEYLLNMNPYTSNNTRFTVEALAVTGSTVNVTVQLLESTDAVNYYAQPNIYGTLYLKGTTNLNGESWSFVASQAPTNVFDAYGRKVFSFPAQTNWFYKAYIQ